MKAIFGLVKDYRLRPVDNIIGDFFAPMGRKAMQEYGLRLRVPHQPGVDLVRLEQVVPALPIAVSHRYPRVGHHAFRTGDGAFGILPDANVGT